MRDLVVKEHTGDGVGGYGDGGFSYGHDGGFGYGNGGYGYGGGYGSGYGCSDVYPTESLAELLNA